MFDMIFDFATIALLATTIGYSWKLNKKLEKLSDPKSAIAQNIDTFSAATETAAVAVEELQVKGEEICKAIDEKIRKAQILADEMEFLTLRANRKVAELKNAKNSVSERTASNSTAEMQLLKALKDREFQEAFVN